MVYRYVCNGFLRQIRLRSYQSALPVPRILEKTPPELAKDIIHAGIYITGGGSKIQNLDQLFTEITNIKVNTCDNPEETAVRGLSKIATDSKYKRLPFSIKTNNLK